MKRNLKLRHLNTGLSLLLMMLALYIIAWPFLPSFSWWAQHDLPLVSNVLNADVKVEATPNANSLIVPSLGLREEIYEGAGVETVNRGVWHRPATSSPDKGSNTVLVGHRFTYSGQSVFYNLDKVKVGDEVVVFWNQQRYNYKVYEIITVPPEAVEIETATDNSILTLYTCTPLLTAKDRLIVKASIL
jgi:sortase A